MIAQLLKKKTDEIKHKDFCADDLNINQFETERGVQWRPVGSSLCGAAALAGSYLAYVPGWTRSVSKRLRRRRTAMERYALQYRVSMLWERMVAATSGSCSLFSRRLCPMTGAARAASSNGDAQTPESKRLLSK